MYWGNELQKKMHIEFLMEQYNFLTEPQPICPYLPNSIDIDISNRCNLKCISCFHSIDSFVHLPDMTFDTFLTALDQIEGNASRITIGNHGEPLLHKKVFNMLEEVKKRGFFVNFICNGALLSREKAHRLLDTGVDRVVFSVDSVDPDIYPQIRVGGKINITLPNILYFLKINFENDFKTYVNISMVDTPLALSSKINLYDYFSKLPVQVVYTSSFLNFHDMLSIKEDTKFRKEYDRANKKTNIPICVNGFDRILIRPNGDVSLCGIDWDYVHILGNISITPYTELWNNQKAQEFRSALINRNYSIIEHTKKLCSQCDAKFSNSIEIVRSNTLNLIASNIKDTKELSQKVDRKYLYENLLIELEKYK